MDVTSIKNTVKSIFDSANTTTASYDISQSLTCGRIKAISTRSPNSSQFGSDVLPAIAIYSKSKRIDLQDISRNQLTAQRKGTYTLEIAGILWNSDSTSFSSDQADNDLEKLMQNIEEVLRRNDNLSGTVLYQKAYDVTYHDLQLSEQENYKVGIMSVDCVSMY